MSSVEEVQAEFAAYKTATDAKIAELVARLDALESSKSNGTPARPTSAAKPPVSRPTTAAKPASAKPNGTAARPTSATKKPDNVGKKPSANPDVATNVDPKKLGSYQVGKRKIYYVIPSAFVDQKENETAPNAELVMSWVYGYNGKAARNNLFFVDKDNPNSRLVYSIAGTGVVYDAANHKQSFFLGHNEDIVSLAVNTQRKIVATGQIDPKGAGKPYICIWNYDDQKETTRLHGFHDRGIAALAFSPDGTRLVSVGQDDSHTAGVWDFDTDSKTPIAQSMVAKDEVYGIAVNGASKDFQFVAYGNKLLKLFTLAPNDIANSKSKFVLKSVILSSFQATKVVQKGFHSACFLSNGDLVVGTETGEIYIFKGQDFHKSLDAHKGVVGGICETKDGGFASVGSDGQLIMWNGDYTQASTVDLGKSAKGRSIDYNPAGHIVVGTEKNSILDVDLSNNSVNTLQEGHSGEIWGCAVHPNGQVVVTAGHDKVLRAWDYTTQKAIPEKVKTFKDKIGAVAFSPDGKTLAIGQHGGKIALIDYDTFEVKYEKKHRGEQIDAVAFSPNGQLLAIGSWDQMAELIDLESMSSVTLKGHTSSITHLGFSTDSKYLQTNSRDYEILFWDVETGKRVDKAVTGDVEWYEWTCVLGWPVKGVYGKGQDGTDINATNISFDSEPSKRLVASGNDTGLVSLHRYPATQKGIKQYTGHSSHVTNVRFTRDTEYLFSTGGNDLAVIQWKIERA